MIKKLSVLISVLFIAVSCTLDADAIIPTYAAIVSKSEGGEFKFGVQSSGSWKAQVSGIEGLVLEPDHGEAGYTELKLTFPENKGEKSLEAQIIFSCGKAMYTTQLLLLDKESEKESEKEK